MAGIQCHHLFLSLLFCVSLNMVTSKYIKHISNKDLKYDGVEHIESTEILKRHINFFKKNDCVYSISKNKIHYACPKRPTLPPWKSQDVLDQKRPYIRPDYGQQAAKKFECPSAFGTSPDPTNCRNYYLCIFDKPRKMRCDSSKLYDEDKEKCADKDTVDCGDRDGDGNKVPGTTKQTTGKPKFTTVATTTKKGTEDVKKFKCPYTWGNFPDPKDCTKYYLCLNKRPSQKTCKDPELYDVEEEKCRHKDKVDCGSRFNPREPTTKEPENTIVPTTAPATEPTRQEQSTPEEPITAEETTLGEKSSASQEPEVTDEPSSLETTPEEIATEDGTSSETPGSTPSPLPESTTSPEDESSETPGTTIDTNKPTGKQHTFPDFSTQSAEPEVTSENVRSSVDPDVEVSSEASTSVEPDVEVSSEASTSVEPDVEVSSETSTSESTDHGSTPSSLPPPETTPEGEDSTSSTDITEQSSPSDSSVTPSEVTPTFTCPFKKGNFAHNDCSLYYACRDDTYTIETCREGTLFHSSLRMCYDENVVDCGDRNRPVTDDGGISNTEESSVPTDQPEESTTEETTNTLPDLYTCPKKKGNFEYATDCSVYYSCRNNKAELVKCPVGFLFSTELSTCYDEKKVDCGSRIIPSTGDQDIEEISSPSAEQPSTESTSEDQSSSVPEVYMCPKKKGNFAHSVDCALYHSCRNGEDQLVQCPLGFLFSTELSTCYDENKVECGSRKRM